MLRLLATHRLRSGLSGVLFALCSALNGADAADLGPILVESPAEQPLRAELSLSLRAEEPVEELRIGIGSPMEYGWLEIERPSWIDDVELGLVGDDAEPRIRLSTAAAPPDRSFSLLLVVTSPLGRSLRQYDVVLYPAEVLQPPAAPTAEPVAEIPVERPGDAPDDAEPPTPAEASTVSAAPRPSAAAERRELQLRRNLTISSAGSRVAAAAFEKRAQRLEETAAAQRRALEEANTRIAALQAQLGRLEQLLALKAVPPPAGPVATPPDKPAAAPPSASAGAPAAQGGTSPAAEAAAEPTTGASAPAEAAADAATAAPTAQTEGESAPKQAASSDTDPGVAPAAANFGRFAALLHDPAQLAAALGGLLLAVLGIAWWRRRRARRQKQAEAMAAAAAGTAVVDDAFADAVIPDDEPPGPAAEDAALADAEVATAAIDAALAARLDAVVGDAMTDIDAPRPVLPVARLESVTAEPEPEAAGADPLDTLFSNEAIAAAQAAIEATAAAPAPAAEAPMPDLEALLADDDPGDAPAGAVPAVDALAAGRSDPVLDAAAARAEPDSTPPAPAPTTAPAPAPRRTRAAKPSPPPPPPPEPEAPPPSGAAAGEADAEADLEDVEVNLAKAYIDMGDPDGARAILEGMMNDSENPGRGALALRTMRRFGLQPSQPPAEPDGA